VTFERVVMEEVGGGCFTPQGVYCRERHIRAEVLSLDGCRRVRREGYLSSAYDAREFGQLLRSDAFDLIQEAYMKLGLKE